jgi:signal transduction histidine kinase
VTRRLLASYLALTAVVLVTLEVPLGFVDERIQQHDLQAKVERDAYVIASLAEDRLQYGLANANLQPTVKRYAARTHGRAIVVDAAGHSIADSAPLYPGEKSFATRPEIVSALEGVNASGIRYSHTLQERLLYVAVPVASGGNVYGAVRITYPTSAVDARVRRDRLTLFLVGLAVLAGTAAIGVVLARSVGGPLRRVEETAVRVGGGDLDARAPEEAGPPEVRRLAVELNRTTAKLQALLSSQEQFVADASHELRTPLTALRLRLENGETEAALGELERLARLVDDLLALARADTAAEPARPLPLAELVRRRVELWRPLAEEHGLTLAAEGNGAVVRAASGRAEQVLDNLLANAIDASPPSGRVTIAADGPELHVLDEGPGLTAEQRERAFDRFWTSGKSRGSGLGLAIAKRLVELDGGTIELRRGPQGGTDATVRYVPV